MSAALVRWMQDTACSSGVFIFKSFQCEGRNSRYDPGATSCLTLESVLLDQKDIEIF